MMGHAINGVLRVNRCGDEAWCGHGPIHGVRVATSEEWYGGGAKGKVYAS